MRLFLLAIVLMSGWGMAQSSQPSLADLSKQARERKAKAHKPSRLITNADLKNFQNAPVSVSKAAEEAKPAQETKAAEAEARASSEEAEYAKLLAEWQPKFQAAVMDYTNAVTKGLVLQLRLNNFYNSAYFAPYYAPYDVLRGRFAGGFGQTTKEIESNQEEVATAEKAIETLKVEARAAGVKEGDITAMVGELLKPAVTDLQTLERPMPPNAQPPGVYAPIW